MQPVLYSNTGVQIGHLLTVTDLQPSLAGYVSPRHQREGAYGGGHVPPLRQPVVSCCTPQLRLAGKLSRCRRGGICEDTYEYV
ncbi:hypothetical protein MCOR25_005823 [Pyricularia grisea]|nr:hypothetical protein MCOR25_005823 [Pyricularia grisea]